MLEKMQGNISVLVAYLVTRTFMGPTLTRCQREGPL